MKKFLSWALLLTMALCVLGYFGANFVLDEATRQVIAHLRDRSRDGALQVIDARFEEVRLTSLSSAEWHGLRATVQLSDSEALQGESLFSVSVGSVRVGLTGSERAVLEASDIRLVAAAALPAQPSGLGAALTSAHFDGDLFRTQLSIDPLDPRPGAERMFRNLVSLVETGQTASPLELRGTAGFVVRGLPCEARVQIADEGGNRVLALSVDDLRVVAAKLDQDVTDAELALLSTNPTKVPKLFSIRDDAETTARDAFREDATVSEDAYRHVLWSFLLTKDFGAEFAENVTDAHEEGLTGNTEEERRMDFHNNGIGRKLAQAGVRRSEIRNRVMSDRDVIRRPR